MSENMTTEDLARATVIAELYTPEKYRKAMAENKAKAESRKKKEPEPKVE